MRGMRLRHLSTLSARRNSKLCRGINQRFYTHQVWTPKKTPFCIDNIVQMASGGPLGSNLAQNAPKMAKKYPKSIFKRKTIGGHGHRLRLGVGPIPKFFTFPIYDNFRTYVPKSLTQPFSNPSHGGSDPSPTRSRTGPTSFFRIALPFLHRTHGTWELY